MPKCSEIWDSAYCSAFQCNIKFWGSRVPRKARDDQSYAKSRFLEPVVSNLYNYFGILDMEKILLMSVKIT